MMSTNKIIVLVMIASFVLFQHVQAEDSGITSDEYLGVWYDVALIFPMRSITDPITCQWAQSTPQDDDYESFTEILRTESRTYSDTYKGNGKLVDSDLHISYSANELDSTIYEVTRYNYGQELILRDKSDGHNSALVSRNPEMVSIKAIRAFEKLAGKIGGFVHYIDNENCEEIPA